LGFGYNGGVPARLIERFVRRQSAHGGKAVRFRVDEVRLPNGKRALREYLAHPGAVAVVPFVDNNTILLVRQYRYPVGEVTLEIPAGKLDAGEPIRVSDVLRKVAVSRSWLERRFQQALGRTPAEEIRRVHLEQAKRLLADTDLPVPDVASASGFGSREYLAYAFKEATGLTPRAYRTNARGR